MCVIEREGGRKYLGEDERLALEGVEETGISRQEDQEWIGVERERGKNKSLQNQREYIKTVSGNNGEKC